MYDFFVGREGADDTELEYKGKFGEGEGFGGKDGNALDTSEDSSVWYIMDDDKRGLLGIASLYGGVCWGGFLGFGVALECTLGL